MNGGNPTEVITLELARLQLETGLQRDFLPAQEADLDIRGMGVSQLPGGGTQM